MERLLREPTPSDLLHYTRRAIQLTGIPRTSAEPWEGERAQPGDVEVCHRWRDEKDEWARATLVVTGETLRALMVKPGGGEAGLRWLGEQLKSECEALRRT